MDPVGAFLFGPRNFAVASNTNLRRLNLQHQEMFFGFGRLAMTFLFDEALLAVHKLGRAALLRRLDWALIFGETQPRRPTQFICGDGDIQVYVTSMD